MHDAHVVLYAVLKVLKRQLNLESAYAHFDFLDTKITILNLTLTFLRSIRWSP